METTPDRPHQCAETALVKVSLTHAAKSCGCFSVHISLTSQQPGCSSLFQKFITLLNAVSPLAPRAPGPMPAWLSCYLSSLSSISFAGSSSFPWLVCPQGSSSALFFISPYTPIDLIQPQVTTYRPYTDGCQVYILNPASASPFNLKHASLAAAYLTFPFLTGVLT